MINTKYVSTGIGLLLIFLTACSGSMYNQGRSLVERGEYDRAIGLFYDEVRQHPASAEAWRELGIAYYKKGDLDKAEDALKQALNIASDARTNLYLGLIYERQDDPERAVAAYRAALSMKPARKTRDLLLARLEEMVRQKLQREVRMAIAGEQEIAVDTIPDNTIGVLDFENSQLPADMAPISKGLAEMVSLDLARVNSLRVVDRLKIDQIIKELKLSSTRYSDPAFSPRVGRLLGSRRLVTGALTGIGDEEVRLNGALVDAVDSAASFTEPSQKELTRFFELEKEFVFRLIDDMGITLTAAERDSIAKIPTESYLAFLAYSRGLEYRSRGLYKDAHREFNDAVSLDHNFQQAKAQQDALAFGPGTASGSAESFESYETNLSGLSDQEQPLGDLDGFQGATLNSAGFIRVPQQSGRFGRGPDLPPRPEPIINTGIVTIRGYINVEP